MGSRYVCTQMGGETESHFLGKKRYSIRRLFATLFCSLSIPSPPPSIRYYIKRLLSFQGKNIAGIVAATRKFRYPSFEISARSDAIPLVCPNFFSFSFWQRKGGDREEVLKKIESRFELQEEGGKPLSNRLVRSTIFFFFFTDIVRIHFQSSERNSVPHWTDPLVRIRNSVVKRSGNGNIILLRKGCRGMVNYLHFRETFLEKGPYAMLFNVSAPFARA